MGNAQETPAVSEESRSVQSNTEPKKKRAKCPMCVCKDERALRDLCILENGEEACADAIEKLNACLRKEGFGEFKARA